MKMYDEIPSHVFTKYNAGELHSVLIHAYLMKEPISKLSSYNRPGGILDFLQNNTVVLRFIL